MSDWIFTPARRAHLDRVRARAAPAAAAWRRSHPQRCSDLLRESCLHSLRTKPERKAHLARMQQLGADKTRLPVDWAAVRALRLQGLSWRRVALILGCAASTLIRRRREMDKP